MLNRRQFHLGALGLAAAALLPGAVRGQAGDYPNRPVKIIVPYAAGGGPDVLTRKMAVKLAERTQGPATVAQAPANSAPDTTRTPVSIVAPASTAALANSRSKIARST